MSSLSYPAEKAAGKAQQRVEPEQNQQRDNEQQDAGEAVRKALPRGIAEMVGDQYEDHHAHDVGAKSNRQNAGDNQAVVQPALEAHQVEIQQPERGKAEHR